MGYKLEDVHKEFVEAMTLYARAMESLNNSVAQLKVAENRLETALTDLTEILGEWEEGWGYHSETSDIFSGGSLFKQLGKGAKSFDDFFGLGGLF